MTELLSIRNLSISFGKAEQLRSVLQPLSLTLSRGKLLALVGESGSGKSVTALSILRLLPAEARVSGELLFSDGGKSVDLLELPQAQLEQLRGNRIAMIFQEPMTALNPVLTCGQQIVEVLQKHKKLSRAEARRAAIAWLGKVRLP
ncbi:MAG: ABC transporter ATP-binding protein, partial [Sphingobacteriales bacterium]